MESISVFLDTKKFADFRWKMPILAELMSSVTWSKYILDIP